MKQSSEPIADPGNISSYKHFKHQTMLALKPEGSVYILTALPLSAWLVADDSDVTKHGAAVTDFEFNGSSLKYIEYYLERKVKPRILKFAKLPGGGVEIKRIKTRSGIATSSEEELGLLNRLLNCIGLLVGQCIAQECDGEWVDKDGSLWIKTDKGTSTVPDANPFSKVFKFVTLGQEDSLVGFLQAIQNWEEDDVMIEKFMCLHRAHGTLPVGYRLQKWNDKATGKLTHLNIIDSAGKVLFVNVVMGEAI